MLRRKFLQSCALAIGLATVEAHRVLGEIVPLPPPPPPIEERFLCEVKECRTIGGVQFFSSYIYAANETEIRAAGFVPEDFGDVRLDLSQPERNLQFRGTHATKEEK